MPLKTSIFREVVGLDASMDELWTFFSTARNLEHLTPPSQGLRIESGGDEPIHVGAAIRISVRPLPFFRTGWLTRITAVVHPGTVVEDGAWFIDVQEHGPFSLWRHLHAFRSIPSGGTAVMDRVEYALPLGWLGRIIAGRWALHQLEELFRFRRDALIRQCGAAPIPEEWRDGWPLPEAPGAQ